jgi:O-antigen ligase
LRLGLLLVVLTISGYTLLLLHDVLLEFLGRDATLTNRTIIWQLIEPYILKEFIFGYGFGAFWASDAVFGFLDRWSFIGNAHSGYYEAMLQGGIVCLLIVLAIAFKSLYLLFKAYIVGKSGALTATLIAIFCIQLAVNFIGFIVLNHNSVDMFLFLLAFFMINSLPSSNQEIELKK